jgi:hypothetical protein
MNKKAILFLPPIQIGGPITRVKTYADLVTSLSLVLIIPFLRIGKVLTSAMINPINYKGD